ncbi:Serine-threonine kinase receptor-associated protein [Tetrabaena socialis]|uniref:Serine-threonine kinase receptor-associated protein n=1 Tax=Tetrabaena socialis TaxID=47790 RepID=A0A2J7ZHT9_9CHLO|nr:Serine-threonine kinase receptor-associated protein [Tetrabaena socialis]|eukprot:PNG99836.1 Serine-threonine kinase receptor-associated protein [Tetrabaena socialis]
MAGRRVPIVCHGHTRPIVELNYSQNTPEGYFLASASKDGKPMLRHGENGDWYGTFEGHKGAVWACVLDTPALKCATGSADFSARVWDACGGTQLHEFKHNHIVRCVNFSHASTRLATGGMEKTVRIFDLEKPEAEPMKLPPAAVGIRSVNFIQDDKTLLCAYVDKPGVGVYDVRSLQQVQTLKTASMATSVEVSFDQQYVTTAEGAYVRFFDATTLQQLKEHLLAAPAESASYCAARRKFVAGGQDMWVHLYDYDTGQELECNKGHHGPVHTIRWAPAYDAYASGSEDGTIRVWFPDGGSEVRA